MNTLKRQGSIYRPVIILAIIFLAGIVVEISFKIIGLSTGNNQTSNLIVLILFFLAVFLIFAVAAILFLKGERLKAEFTKATAIIKEAGQECGLEIFSERNIFEEDILKTAFSEFIKENNVRLTISEETQANINDYINYSILEQAVKTHYLDQIPGIMTGLGILGTFVGLSIGLNSFELSGLAKDVENSIKLLMEGIKVAFHTSICGILYSIMFNLYYHMFYENVEKELDRFVETFTQNVINSADNGSAMTLYKYQEKMSCIMKQQTNILSSIDSHVTGEFVGKLSETLTYICDKATNLAKVNEALQDSAVYFKNFCEKVDVYQATVNNSIEMLTEQIDRNNQNMEKQLVTFNEALKFSQFINDNMLEQVDMFDQTMNYSKSVNESMEKFIINFNKEIEKLDALGKKYEQNFKEEMQAIYEVAKSNMELSVSNGKANLDKIGEAAEQKIEQITVVKKTTTEDIQRASDNLTANIEKLNNSMEMKARNVLDDYHRELTRQVSAFSETIKLMSDNTVSMKNITAQIPDIMTETKDNVTEQFETMQEKLDQYLEYADKLHRDISTKWDLIRKNYGVSNQ